MSLTFDFPARYDILQKTGFYALGPGTFLFLYNSCRWLWYELWPVVRRAMSDRGTNRPVSGVLTEHKREETRLLYSGMFVISIVGCIVFLGSNAATADAIAKWGPIQMMLGNMAYILFVLTLSILVMRTVKFEMVQSLYALIEGTLTVLHLNPHQPDTTPHHTTPHHIDPTVTHAYTNITLPHAQSSAAVTPHPTLQLSYPCQPPAKKTYVRYISHELRTPMNTACLGLNFLIGALHNTAGPGGSEDTAQTLQDIFGACETAVDILNGEGSVGGWV